MSKKRRGAIRLLDSDPEASAVEGDLWYDTTDNVLKHRDNVAVQSVETRSHAALSTGRYNVKDYGAVGDGTTDDTAAVQSAVTAALATGGTVYFPPATYKLAPGAIQTGYSASGTVPTNPIRLVGVGASWTSGTAGSVLDFSVATPVGRGVGCIELFGKGYVEMTGLHVRQTGTAHTIPYMYITNAVMSIHDNVFIGHTSKSGTTCDQDAILLGCPPATVSPTINGTETGGFQGYGTVIEANWFNNLRRCVWIRVWGNNTVVRANAIWGSCGSDGGSADASGAAIEVSGGTAGGGYTMGCIVAENTIEVANYYYGIRFGDSTEFCVSGITDSGIRIRLTCLDMT